MRANKLLNIVYIGSVDGAAAVFTCNEFKRSDGFVVYTFNMNQLCFVIRATVLTIVRPMLFHS